MKTLIVSYFFPPCSIGAATVMYNLCKYLPKSDFVVMTAGGSKMASRLGVYDKEYSLDCKTVSLPVYGNSTIDRIKFSLLAILIGLRLQSNEKIDCIFAVYPYFSDLLVGYFLASLTGKRFIVYMHDLFSEVKRGTFLFRMLVFLENKVLKSADRVLVMNENYVTHYSPKLHNLAIVPPSIEPPEVGNDKPFRKPSGANTKKITITFTGSLYEAHEDAVIAFFKAAKTVADIDVLFATPMNWRLASNLKKLLRDVNLGFLSKKKCLELQRNADVLFLPLAFNSPYPEEIECAFPCKLLEYLAAGKPILAVVPKGSFVSSFIEKYNVGMTVTELSIGKIADALRLLKDEEKRKVYGENALKTVRLFDSRVQSKALMSIIENIISP